MPNGTYGGVRGRKTKAERKLLCFPPTRLGVTMCNKNPRERCSQGFSGEDEIRTRGRIAPTSV